MPPFIGIDPHEAVVAAHELGHWLHWKAAGIPLGSVQLLGWGSAVHGVACTQDMELDAQATYLYVVGTLTGPVADRRWCEQYGERYWPGGSAPDEQVFQDQIRDPLFRGIPEHRFRRDAEQSVARLWIEIHDLVPELIRKRTM